MKLKYGICGSHSVGKSSLVFHLANLLKQKYDSKTIKVIEENIREISPLFNGKLNTPEFQRYCMIDHLQKELFAELMYSIVVVDRTALDCLCYGLVYGVKLPSEYFSLALNHLNTFTEIYFIRPDSYEAPIIDDGFRDLNIELRNEVDKEFERILKLWGGKYTEIRTSNILNYNYLDSK